MDEHESKTGVIYPDMVSQEAEKAVRDAKVEAKKVRDGISKLSVYEKMLAREQLAAVTRLVEAVERI